MEASPIYHRVKGLKRRFSGARRNPFARIWNFIARIRSRWDAPRSCATRHWLLSWISLQSKVSLRYDTVLKTWKKNASPLFVSKPDRHIRFVAAF